MQCGISAVDLAIIGAGPAGMTAAVYAASEGLSTLVLNNMRHRCSWRDHSSSGNMLALIACCVALIVCTCAIGLSIYFHFSSFNRLQFAADQFALTAARILNHNDQIGQMNNLVADSRQLVFDSRNVYVEVVEKFPHLTPLANALLEDSRTGSDSVMAARKQLADLIVDDIHATVIAANKPGGLGQAIALPWADSAVPEVLDLKLGSIKAMESNVEAPFGDERLLVFDTKRSCIDPLTHLYYAGIILPLPEDDDKTFRLSPLPAPVKGTVAPARLTGHELFQPWVDLIKDGQRVQVGLEQLPSAIHLKLRMGIANQVAVNSDGTITTESTAATVGASPVIP
jgi:hypothetical protein